MIYISANTPSTAWKEAFLELYRCGKEVEINGFYKNECAAIEIMQPAGLAYTPLFPMSKSEVDAINEYITTGSNENKVEHHWTKLYRQRIFIENDHIGKIVNTLKEWPDCPRAQIAIWKNDVDLKRSEIAPCLQLVWFKILDKHLCMHVHMRTTDCYGKLLLNFNEFIAIQKYVSRELDLPLGVYRQFVDSLHFHTNNKREVDELKPRIESADA